MALSEIRISPQSLERFAPLVGAEQMERMHRAAQETARRLTGCTVWNVNSTAIGGGVSEMLRAVLSYVRGVAIDARWLVIDGDPSFFRVTKRLHHALHGSRGDESPLGPEERSIYEATLRRNGEELAALVRPHDVVFLHDPQTAGLAGPLARAGALVVWRSHVGSDRANEQVEKAWDFLRPYLSSVASYVFTRETYVPVRFDRGSATIVQPSIDAFATKNQELDEHAMRGILLHTGLVDGPDFAEASLGFVRQDGSAGRVGRRADVVRLGPAPSWDTPLVVQVGRWDPLKDPVGVIRGFARLARDGFPADAELMLAGPNVNGIADDPEQVATYRRAVAAFRELPHAIRARVHLATLPTADVDENAAIINALQRHATVIAQKSLAEGFGLTVTEAMWKGRPVVASAVGGIRDQIRDGVDGVLLQDPTDLGAFAAALRGLLLDPGRAARLGASAHERVREAFLGIRHLIQYGDLLAALDDRRLAPRRVCAASA